MSRLMNTFQRIFSKTEMVSKETAIPGRNQPLFKPNSTHLYLKTSLFPPFPEVMKSITFGLGCFWGAERLFWNQKGVYSTHVGYSGGFTKHPTYEETCSGKTGHAEVVRVIYDPEKISLSSLLKVFWENHDPTSLNKQGNDIGTMYRSAIYCTSEPDLQEVEQSKFNFQKQLEENGFGQITTEIKLVDEFYYAEEYHQQYLYKNKNGYCHIRGTGVTCQ